MKSKKFFLRVLGVIAVYICFHLVMFGAHLSFCEYTVKEEPSLLPSNTELTLKKSAYSHQRKYPGQGCTPILGKISRELYSQELTEAFPGGTIEKLGVGTKFSLIQVLARTKHGIGTIDSGPGPIFIYVVKDQAGNLYQTVELTSLFGM